MTQDDTTTTTHPPAAVHGFGGMQAAVDAGTTPGSTDGRESPASQAADPLRTAGAAGGWADQSPASSGPDRRLLVGAAVAALVGVYLIRRRRRRAR